MSLFQRSRQTNDSQWLDCGPLVSTRKALRRWYESRPGTWLQDDEQRLLDDIVPNLFGYHFLQVGLSNNSDCMRSSRIPHRMIMDIDLDAETAAIANPEDITACPTQIKGMPEALPFAADCLDVLLLPHTLEFTSNPHQVLRETDRVLIPEGTVVILGFNPWSLWMLWRLILGWRHKPPWCGRFLRPARVRDWLQLLGFDITESHSFFFRPPLRHAGLMKKLRFLERFGKRLWPFFGGAYILVAKKRVATLTPIKPRWRPRRSRVVAPELAGNSSVIHSGTKQKAES